MKVIKTSNTEAQESANKIFRGKVSIQSVIGKSEDDLRVIVVNFSPGAVNVFHSHTFYVFTVYHNIHFTCLFPIFSWWS